MESLICSFHLSVAARRNCLCRFVPEIHSHVARTLSNQPTTTKSLSASLLASFSDSKESNHADRQPFAKQKTKSRARRKEEIKNKVPCCCLRLPEADHTDSVKSADCELVRKVQRSRTFYSFEQREQTLYSPFNRQALGLVQQKPKTQNNICCTVLESFIILSK